MASNFRDLKVYQKAYALAMQVFEITRSFPKEERYALTDQVRRSFRSVCRAIGGGYRKRQYPEFFVNKISDADMENTETQISPDFAESCGYITSEVNSNLREKSEEVGRMLNHMIRYPKKYQRKSCS